MRSRTKLNEQLFEAVQSGRLAYSKELIRSGASVNAIDSEGWTPLHFAARSNNPAMVRLLLGHAANPNARDTRGWTPLHCAAVYDAVPCLRELISAGADVNAATDFGHTAQFLARQNNNPRAVALLQHHSAAPQFANEVRCPPQKDRANRDRQP